MTEQASIADWVVSLRNTLRTYVLPDWTNRQVTILLRELGLDLNREVSDYGLSSIVRVGGERDILVWMQKALYGLVLYDESSKRWYAYDIRRCEWGICDAVVMHEFVSVLVHYHAMSAGVDDVTDKKHVGGIMHTIVAKGGGATAASKLFNMCILRFKVPTIASKLRGVPRMFRFANGVYSYMDGLCVDDADLKQWAYKCKVELMESPTPDYERWVMQHMRTFVDADNDALWDAFRIDVGCMLSGDRDEPAHCVLVGVPRSGKSTLLHMMHLYLGGDVDDLRSQLQLYDSNDGYMKFIRTSMLTSVRQLPRTVLTQMGGRFLVVADDLDQGVKSDGKTMLVQIGAIKESFSTRLALVANDAVRFNADDVSSSGTATGRRLVLMNFPHSRANDPSFYEALCDPSYQSEVQQYCIRFLFDCVRLYTERRAAVHSIHDLQPQTWQDMFEHLILSRDGAKHNSKLLDAVRMALSEIVDIRGSREHHRIERDPTWAHVKSRLRDWGLSHLDHFVTSGKGWSKIYEMLSVVMGHVVRSGDGVRSRIGRDSLYYICGMKPLAAMESDAEAAERLRLEKEEMARDLSSPLRPSMSISPSARTSSVSPMPPPPRRMSMVTASPGPAGSTAPAPPAAPVYSEPQQVDLIPADVVQECIEFEKSMSEIFGSPGEENSKGPRGDMAESTKRVAESAPGDDGSASKKPKGSQSPAGLPEGYTQPVLDTQEQLPAERAE